jgi:predicted nuclease with RNAse H fold
MKIVGLDCATVDAKVGLALGVLDEGRAEIKSATLCTRERSAADRIANWIHDADDGVLIAIDAPLGWPKPLAESLIDHSAGVAINTEANAMFRRTTDRFIQQKLKKTPLDVGADRIARTAHAALHLLGSVRARLRLSIPLAWAPGDVSPVAAIEVYPAATLVSHGFMSTGYKKREHLQRRREMIEQLRTRISIHDSVTDLSVSADLVDAAVCVLAGVDFMCERAMRPEDLNLARREGWIWAAPPGVRKA